jgi:methylated-DNA-[protein]-cysteine S-methyltransferase
MRDAIDPLDTSSGEATLDAGVLAREVEDQIARYFAGALRRFDLPLDLAGTGFQLSVWQVIAGVPFGETRTYSGVAAAIGRPTAYRAVGNACASNPIVIIVPCHRIVGADRGLHGFGGGLDTKSWLLRHEGSLDRVNDPRAMQAALSG